MFFVYFLKSLQDQKFYIGFTSDLKKRVAEHNAGMVRSTKYRRPLRLVYFEGYLAEDDAREREKRLKVQGKAMVQLRKRAKRSLGQ